MNFNAEEKIFLEKNKVVILENKHYYNLDVSKRVFNLEYSKPLYFKIGMMFFRIDIWKDLIIDVFTCFIINLQLSIEWLSGLAFDWTRRDIFSPICEDEKYWNRIGNVGYIYLNFSSTHLYFLLVDFLKYIEINSKEVEFVVSLSSSYEPIPVYKFFYNKNLYELKTFLTHEKNYGSEKTASFLVWLKLIDKILNEIFPSKKSILVIEDIYELNTVYSKLKKKNPYKTDKKGKAYDFILKTVVDMKKGSIKKICL